MRDATSYSFQNSLRYTAVTVYEDEEHNEDYIMDDIDSALGSSIPDYFVVEENGRLYHSFKDGKYVLPNDRLEQDRLDLQNHLFGLTLDGKLHFAPIGERPEHVLDIGTGTGIWAIDFANLYPSAQVTGTDLSLVQPPIYVPPNVHFEICDAEEEWDFVTRFDYIHGRMLTVCFRDVRDVFRSALAALKPGGWIEMQDCCFPAYSPDRSMDGTKLQFFFEKLIEGGQKLGRPYGTEPPNYGMYLSELGYVDVHVEIRHWPFGPWHEDKKMKDIGLWSRANALEGLEAVSIATLTRGLGWTTEQVEALLEEVRNDFLDPAIHSYLSVYIVWARKPTPAATT